MRPITKSSRPRGFTLIELSVVIFIIGLLLAFILAASLAATESARVRATQALITKLSVGLEERMEALLATSPTINGAHQFLASVNTPAYPINSIDLPWGLTSSQRALVIARLDQIRAEFPDVFYIDPAVAANPGGAPGDYPIQFGGLPYHYPPDNLPGVLADYVLPIGNNAALYLPDPNYVARSGAFSNTGPGAGVFNTGTGINGASYAAAASLYRLVGYTPKGCDGVDNNVPPNGLVDEYGEGEAGDAEAFVKINTFITNHNHKTARAEMLYAILVGGLGPLGSVFTVEDFKDGEIKDTDNDGVPEFVDGWGEPLQFYRWPFYHVSDIDKGEGGYGQFEARQTNTLDQNSQLVALPWWCNNVSASVMSPKCIVVQNLFGPLHDPVPIRTPAPFNNPWDRSGLTGRRSYHTKFLIVSGGPDRVIGIPRMTDLEMKNTAKYDSFSMAQVMNGKFNLDGTFIPGEGWAMGLDPNYLPGWANDPDYTTFNVDHALDDLTNQGLQNQAGGFR